MTKKIIISLILCFSLISASIQSKAVAPVLVALGFFDAAGAFTSSGMALLATGAMLTPAALQPLIGQRMGMVEFGRDNDGNGTIDQSIRIPLTSDSRDRPLANPELPPTTGYINEPTNPQSKVCPPNPAPSTTVNQGCTVTSVTTYVKTSEFACTIHFTNSLGSGCEETPWFGGSGTAGTISTTTGCGSGYTSSGGNCTLTNPQDACSTGYTNQNGTCELTNAHEVPDGKCDVEVFSPASGAVAYRDIPGDPDCNGSGLTISQAAAIFQMTHPTTNEPVYYSVLPPNATTSDAYGIASPSPPLAGHGRITAMTNTASGGQAVNVDVNSQTGTISQVSTVPLNGQLLREGQVYINAQGQSVTVQAGQLVLAQASGGSYVQSTTNTVASPAINISIPTDYARSGEAETSADKIIEKLDETQESADLLAPELVNPLDSYFNPLRAWSVPVHAGQCPTGSFSWNNNDYNFNVMCQLFNENLTLIQGAMSVFYTILALMIVLGA